MARRFDLLVSYSRHAHVEVAVAGLLARRPVIVDIVDIVRPGLGRRALQLAARLATAVVVNSNATAATVGGAPRRTHLVHPGVDVERFSPGPPDPAMRTRLGGGEAALVGIVGRLDPSKGIELVAGALELGATSGRHPHVATAHLAVIGDRGIAPDGYVEQLRASTTARLGDRVSFPGRIEDVPSVLRSLDVLVNASDAEPFGLSVLEAHAVGTPVVAAAGGGILDFVLDRRTGLQFPPGDAASLADALEVVLSDTELAAAMTTAARTQAVERFDAASRFDLLASIYGDCARSGR
jgi:D-inositol-3-phosphate glycosyltransferase